METAACPGQIPHSPTGQKSSAAPPPDSPVRSNLESFASPPASRSKLPSRCSSFPLLLEGEHRYGRGARQAIPFRHDGRKLGLAPEHHRLHLGRRRLRVV